jgi:hypothetical protein
MKEGVTVGVHTGRVNGGRRLPRVSRDALVDSIGLGGVAWGARDGGVAAVNAA